MVKGEMCIAGVKLGNSGIQVLWFGCELWMGIYGWHSLNYAYYYACYFIVI